MKKIILRCLIALFAVTVTALAITAVITSHTDEVIYKPTLYVRSDIAFAVAVPEDRRVEFSEGSYSLWTPTEGEPIRISDTLKLYNVYSGKRNVKTYYINPGNESGMRISVTKEGRISDKTEIYDISFSMPVSELDSVDFLDYSNELYSISRKTELTENGLRVFEEVELAFGGVYHFRSDYAESFIGGPYKGAEVTVLPADGKASSAVFTSDGRLAVTGIEAGYIRIYDPLSGGVIVPYKVNYDSSPVVEMILTSYERTTGKRLSPAEITPEITSAITSLELTSLPTFLTEEMFTGIFPSVSSIRVSLDTDLEGGAKIFIPESLNELIIESTQFNGIKLNASFYGKGNSATLTLLGRLEITGGGEAPTFSGFDTLTVNVGNEQDSGGVTLISRAATLSEVNAQAVFTDIATLNLNINLGSLSVKAGAGASRISAIKAGRGGDAIDCDTVNIYQKYSTATLTVRGGNGGVGFDGKDGKDGYYVGDDRYIPGTDAAHGGNGGDGGYAIKARILTLRQGEAGSTVTLEGGKGGNGGKGGSGGKGPDPEGFFGFLKDKGDGGNGGNGGAGGDGGYALYITERLDNYAALKVIPSGKGSGGGGGELGEKGGKPGSDGKDGASEAYEILSNLINGSKPYVIEN